MRSISLRIYRSDAKRSAAASGAKLEAPPKEVNDKADDPAGSENQEDSQSTTVCLEKDVIIRINKKILCGQCKLLIEEDGRIQCDKCSNTYHDICTTLDKRQFDQLLQNESDEYICHHCNESGGDLKQELNQLDELQATMHFMSTKFDDILKGINEKKKKIKAVQKENKNLKKEIAVLKTSVKILNDQRVKNDCIINGLECEEDTDAVKTLMKFLEGFDVKIEATNIDESFFLKNKNPETRKTNKQKQTMIVKFNNKKAKQMVMSVKPKLKEKEDILAGRIYAKRSEFSKPKLIKSFDEVDNILLEATTNNTRRSHRRENALPKLPDIICIQETWFDSKLIKLYGIPGYNTVHYCRSDSYGGTSIYVRDFILFSVEICEKNCFMTVSQSPCIIVGDSNVDFITNPQAHDLNDLFQFYDSSSYQIIILGILELIVNRT
ncbi:hypothetical protein CVS40_12823 [Lucilia cuprina]|nr:hypothetical protein CVS40_12823 [Lucilia cuprina]